MRLTIGNCDTANAAMQAVQRGKLSATGVELASGADVGFCVLGVPSCCCELIQFQLHGYVVSSRVRMRGGFETAPAAVVGMISRRGEREKKDKCQRNPFFFCNSSVADSGGG